VRNPLPAYFGCAASTGNTRADPADATTPRRIPQQRANVDSNNPPHTDPHENHDNHPADSRDSHPTNPREPSHTNSPDNHPTDSRKNFPTSFHETRRTDSRDTHPANPAPTDNIRRVPIGVQFVAMVADFSAAAWFQLPPFARHAARALSHATHGVLSPLLFLHVCLILLLVGGIIMLIGRQRLSNLGLRARGVVPALLFAAALWAVLQLSALITLISDGEPIRWNPQWTTAPGALVGDVLGNWLGVALFEELVFRGFLLSQLALHFSRSPRVPKWLATATALLLSSAVFAAGHLPYLCRHHTPAAQLPADLLLLFGWGVLFGLTYLSTRNLWCSIAVHGLTLTPAMLTTTPETVPTAMVLNAAVVIWLSITTLLKHRAQSHSRHHHPTQTQ